MSLRPFGALTLVFAGEYGTYGPGLACTLTVATVVPGQERTPCQLPAYGDDAGRPLTVPGDAWRGVGGK